MLFLNYPWQLSTVVILVLPQMGNTISPVQPTPLWLIISVMLAMQFKDQTVEPASPMDSGVGVYLSASVS